jgi:hypothetical protein
LRCARGTRFFFFIRGRSGKVSWENNTGMLLDQELVDAAQIGSRQILEGLFFSGMIFTILQYGMAAGFG